MIQFIKRDKTQYLATKDENTVLKEIIGVIASLIEALEDNPKKCSKDKINDFYKLLSSNNNIETLKRDTGLPTRNFLKFISIIAATLLTGILPGLLIIGIVYAATGKQPLDLIKSDQKGNQFVNSLNEVSKRYGVFRPKPTETIHHKVNDGDEQKNEPK